MATYAKDFKVKNGLIVEGSNGTINGYNILTDSQDGIDFIVDQIGGTATPNNTPDTVVKRDGSGNFAAGEITADLVGNVTGQVSDISNHDTDDLDEGTNHLYYTDARARNAISGFTGINYDNTTGVINVDLGDFDTDDLSEGASNKYFSTTLVDNHLSGGDGINYSGGTISADLGTGLNFSAGSIAVDRTTVDTWYDESGAAADVATDLTNHINDTSAHGVTGDVVGTTDSQTISNKTLGGDLAAGGYKVSGLATPTANADAATKAYVDTEIANLIDSAPALLDTLNELAAAIGDDEDFIGTVTASIGEKVAKAGDSMTGNLDFGGTNKVTSLGAPTSNGDAANKLYVDDAASTAQTNAENYAESYTDTAVGTVSGNLTTHETATTGIHGVTGNIVGTSDTQTLTGKTIDGGDNTLQNIPNSALDNDSITINGNATALGSSVTLDTDDVDEGTRQYFTTDRAKDAAGYLLENSTQNNISISYDEGTRQLTVTAEDGFAGHTTADLPEDPSGTGTSGTWYFTNARAVNALEAVVPNFTEIDINSVATQVAATTGNIATASTITAYSFAKADYRSAKFLVKCAYSTHTEIAEVLLTLDTSDNIAITEYAIVGTNGSSMTISADISGTDVRLRVTTINNNSTVKVVGTLLA